MKIYIFIDSRTSLGILESQVLAFFKSARALHEFEFTLVSVNGEIQGLNRESYKILGVELNLKDISNSRIYFRTADTYTHYYLLLKMRKNTLYYDFRALLYVESKYRNGGWRLKTMLGWLLEFFVYHTANEIMAVSDPLIRKADNFSLGIRKRRIYKMPCLVFEDTGLIPKKTSITVRDKYRIVYLGGIAKWQCLEVICAYLKNQPREDYTFTVLTYDVSEAINLTKSFGIDATIKTLKTRVDLYSELVEHDAGFLVRQEDDINKVSSPVKLLEYISCGIVPLISSGIGEYSKQLFDNNIALEFERMGGLKTELDEFFKNSDQLVLQQRLFMKNYDPKNFIEKHPIFLP